MKEVTVDDSGMVTAMTGHCGRAQLGFFFRFIFFFSAHHRVHGGHARVAVRNRF